MLRNRDRSPGPPVEAETDSPYRGAMQVVPGGTAGWHA